MIALTKIVSSGLAGLGVSGLGAYFIPHYSDLDRKSSKLIYSEESEALKKGDPKLLNWWSREIEILQQIETLLEEFKRAFQKLKESTSSTHLEILKQFAKASEDEQTLEKSYESSKSKLEKLKNLIERNHTINKHKLDNEVSLQQTKFINKSLHSIGSTITSWGKSIETILCAIHNSDGKQSCDNLKDWDKSDNYDKTDNLDQKFGGGVNTVQGAGSQQAINTLKEVVSNFAEKKKKLKELIKTNVGLNINYWIKQWNLEQSGKFYDSSIKNIFREHKY